MFQCSHTKDGVTTLKYVGAVLMQILMLFLRQSFGHSFVNKKFDFIKMHAPNVKIIEILI
jgi:hypothetical protein